MGGNESEGEIMRKVKVTNAYGATIILDAELSKESKKLFHQCIKCWNNPRAWKEELKYCREYGPCNFHPIIQEKE